MKFSIITPVYNGEKSIKRTIENVISFSKNEQSIEYIIIDDGSIDNTREICLSYANRFSWIKYIYKENGGVSSARNLGIVKSSGEYIIFLDSDDELDCKTMNYLTNYQISSDILILKITKRIGNNTETYPKDQLINSDLENILKSVVNPEGIRGFIGNKMYKNEFLKKNFLTFDRSLVFAEDMDFFIRALIKTSDVKYIDKNLYNYNFEESSYSGDSQLNLLTSLMKILNFLRSSKIRKDTIYEFEKYYLHVLISFCLNSKFYNYGLKNRELLKNKYSALSSMHLKAVLLIFSLFEDIIYPFWKIKKERVIE